MTAYLTVHAVIWCAAILAFAKTWPPNWGPLAVAAGMFAWTALLLIW